jgi:hypothetical protein
VISVCDRDITFASHFNGACLYTSITGRKLTLYSHHSFTCIAVSDYLHCKTKQLREEFAGKKYLPIDLRAKQTRAIRRRLTKEQSSKQTVRATKRAANLPKRRYALKA